MHSSEVFLLIGMILFIDTQLIRNRAKAVSGLLANHLSKGMTSESNLELRILWVALSAACCFPGTMLAMRVLVHL
jgi:hypothetical protein